MGTNVVVAVGFGAFVVASLACGSRDDDERTTATQPVSELDICRRAAETLDCPLGFSPQVQLGGDLPVIVSLDDPSLVEVPGGIFVEADLDADWVGVNVTENAECVVACVLPLCPGPREAGCFAVSPNGVGCSFCSESATRDGCVELIDACGLAPSEGSSTAAQGDPTGG